MEFIEAVKIKNRMLSVNENGNCKIKCDDCPLNRINNGLNCDCIKLARKYPEKYEAILIKWAKEHPIKTNKDALLEVFPDAKLDVDGVPETTPCHLETHDSENCIRCNCYKCRKDFWNKEYKGACENE